MLLFVSCVGAPDVITFELKLFRAPLRLLFSTPPSKESPACGTLRCTMWFCQKKGRVEARTAQGTKRKTSRGLARGRPCFFVISCLNPNPCVCYMRSQRRRAFTRKEVVFFAFAWRWCCFSRDFLSHKGTKSYPNNGFDFAYTKLV